MFVRTVCLASVFLTAFSHAQTAKRPLFPPPKAKVVATPTPAPEAPKPGRAASKPAPARAVPARPAPAKATPAPADPATTAGTPAPAPEARPPRRRTPKAADLLAGYMPSVKAAFSLRWGETITPLLKDFNPGNVSALFKLDADGKVTDFTVTQNTSNEAFAKFCERFVRETAFEKPPEKALVDGQVEIPFTFSIY
jgi:TonB family protein